MSVVPEHRRNTADSHEVQTPRIGASVPRGKGRRSLARWAIVTVSLSALLVLGRLLPTVPGMTLIVESLLPWSILPLFAVLISSALTRRVSAIAFALTPVVVWGCLFAPELSSSPGTENGSRSTQIRLATHNTGGRSNDPELTARSIEESAPDIVALQELEAEPGAALSTEMDATYPHSARLGTLGLWSKWSLDGPTEVDLGSRFVRGLHTTMMVADGAISVYVLHLPSVRPGMEEARNRALTRLARRVEQDPAQTILLAGDLNTASTDRHYSLLSDQLDDSSEATPGFGFTWPAPLPVMRLDHIMMTGARPLSDRAVDTGASDHRMVVAEVSTMIG